MAKAKNQHYVPKAYLRYFVPSNKKLFIFDKKNLEVRFQHVNKVACQNYFYDIDFKDLIKNHSGESGFNEKEIQLLEEMDEQHIENFFSQTIENDIPRLFNHILGIYTLLNVNKYDEVKVISENQRFNLSILITYQLLRTKEFRNTINQALLSIGKKYLEKFSDINLEGMKMEVNKDLESGIHASFMMDHQLIETITNIIYNRIWIFGINETGIPFYTSDNPVVRRGHLRHKSYSGTGLGCQGLEIAYPINSNLILIILEESYFRNMKNKDLQFELFYDRKKAIYYNSMQVLQSNRQVYCKLDGFNLAREICEEHPECRQEDRMRIDIN